MKVDELIWGRCLMEEEPFSHKKTGLKNNVLYAIEEINIGQSHSSVTIEGKKYNSAMFEYYDKNFKEIDIYKSKYSPYFRNKLKKEMTYEEKVKQIFETFGYKEQRRKLAEEVDEFNDEVLLFENGVGDIEKLEEEFRDINVVLDGFREFYEILKELDQEYKTFKADRTLKRIESGYYKKPEEV